MKGIVSKINESNEKIKSSSSFKEKVKYSRESWDEWLGQFYTGKTNKHIMLGNDPDSGVILIYLKNSNNLTHIGTYNPKTTVLMTDDIQLFGNEK